MSKDQGKTQETISGIDVMRGMGAAEAKSFWADAWDRVIARRGAQFGLLWIGIIGFFAIFAPVIANGLPIWSRELALDGSVARQYSPLWEALTATDILLLVGGVFGPLLMLLPLPMSRQRRLGLICAAALLGGLAVILVALFQYLYLEDASSEVKAWSGLPWTVALASSMLVVLILFWLPTFRSMSGRIIFALVVSLFTGVVIADRWTQPTLNPERFVRGQIDGTMDNTYTIIPWSPTQSRAVFYSRVPSSSVEGSYQLVADERLADGIVFYVQTVSFNLKSTEDFPVSRKVEGKLAQFLMLEEGSDLLKIMSRELEEDAGISPQVVDRFIQIGAGLRRYEQSVLDENAPAAMAEAVIVRDLVAGFEPRNRNARIMIQDASDELMDKIDERINFVRESGEVGVTSYGSRHFMLGTDPIGRDVLSQMLHACRLSISIGLVSTGLSVLIGVVIGSLMGYFGGWVDLVLSRVVEIFMAIPVLFLLIVAASVLPRNTYVMMAIIGCVTWTGSARFIRAEFLKLRNQDFVQSCRAVGLPLHSTLFRHMLPNGVTPVLVQASFGIAAAIIAEATLSYLGLGPYGQSSWGKLLSLTTGETGVFLWWMAVFPGVAIFLTVLAYNVLGENLRDAIDPKMRKAAH